MSCSRRNSAVWIVLAFSLLPAAVSTAAAATVTGPDALALAAVVAQHSPLLGVSEKNAMARLFAGDSNFRWAAKKKISVTADSVVCRTSNVDIAARSCALTFKKSKRALKGREANEIYATAATARVPAEGAAGSNFRSISKLNCTIDPQVIRQKAGGGAKCSWQAE